MITVSISVTGEVAEFVKHISKLYNKSQESVIYDLIAKGYDPDGKIGGEDISIAAKRYDIPALDKPAQMRSN